MTENIPIFDTLTHPTIDGNWILPRYSQCAIIDNMITDMRMNNIQWAFAVGMAGIGGYDEDLYIDYIKNNAKDKLFPIAYFEIKGKNRNEVVSALDSIKKKGYVGIKLHPRIGSFSLNDDMLPFVIDCANEIGLVVMLCTYFYSQSQNYRENNIESLGDMLTKIRSDSRVVLLHGGSVRLLETMEIVRAFTNTILDLSMTLCKYDGSSLDMDIQYLFRKFDRRICIGTDYPESSHMQLRERFNLFASNTSIEKAENIAYKNIMSFTGIATQDSTKNQ